MANQPDEARSTQLSDDVELAVHRELRKHLDSHVNYLARLSTMTAAAAVGILALLGGATAWLTLDKADAVIEKMDFETRIQERFRQAETIVSGSLEDAVRKAVGEKEKDIEGAVTKVFNEKTTSRLLEQIKADLGSLPGAVNQLALRTDAIQKDIGTTVVLAMARVRSGRLEEGASTPGVTFDGGWVGFQNERNLAFVPVVSDVWYQSYATETHYIRNIDAASNRFLVWRTPLDTGPRNTAGTDFTAIVLGLKR